MEHGRLAHGRPVDPVRQTPGRSRHHGAKTFEKNPQFRTDGYERCEFRKPSHALVPRVRFTVSSLRGCFRLEKALIREFTERASDIFGGGSLIDGEPFC